VASAVRSDAAERRAVLLISEGHRSFVQELNNGLSPAGQAAFNEYLQVLKEAALGNVAIYTVDPRGLRAPSAAQVASRGLPLSFPGPGSASAPSPFVVESDAFGSLALLARNTGGVQTLWTNDLTSIVPQMLQDSRQYYRLAYVQPDPPSGKKPPPSRSIEVKVARKGVDVRARQRYVPAPVS
jgi:VWFA-related protein